MSPDMAGFGFDLKIDANDFCIRYYTRIDYKGKILSGQGVSTTTSVRIGDTFRSIGNTRQGGLFSLLIRLSPVASWIEGQVKS